MSAAFTPGPWQWFPSVSKERPAVIDTALGVESTNVTIIAEVHRGKQFEANANLIAAAPELYEALRALRSALSSGVEVTQSVLPKVDAALAKARGESA